MTEPGLTSELSPRRLKRLLKDYVRQLHLEPDNMVIRLKVAFVLKELGRPDEAIETYEAVARAFAEEGRLVQAIAVCKGILEIDSAHRATQEMLADLVQRQRPPRRTPSLRMQQVDGRWVAVPVAAETIYSEVGEAPGEPTGAGEEEETPTGNDVEQTPVGTRSPTDVTKRSGPGGVRPPRPASEDAVPILRTGGYEAPPELEPNVDDLPPAPDALGAEPLDFPDETKAMARGALLIDLPAPSGPPPTWDEPPPGDVDVTAAASPSTLRRQVIREASNLELEALDEADVTDRVQMDGAEGVIDLEAEEPPRPRFQPVPTVRERPQRVRTPPTPEGDETSSTGTDLFDASEEAILQQLAELPAPEAEASGPLESIPLFSDLPRDAFVELLGKMAMRREGPGVSIVREGDTGDAFYVVVAGLVRVTKQRPDGQETEVARLGPGSFFGEFALLGDQKRHATVTSVGDVELFEISRQLMEEIATAHPEVLQTLRRFYRERMLATLLCTSPLLAALSADERMQVAGQLEGRKFAAEQAIIEEGKPSDGLYLILTGSVEVTIRDTSVGKLGEGSYFGEMSLLRGGVASATVRASVPSEVVLLPARDFYHVMASHPVVWQEIRREAARREASNAAILTGNL
jgi:CRP-like cAMP-binding protein